MLYRNSIDMPNSIIQNPTVQRYGVTRTETGFLAALFSLAYVSLQISLTSADFGLEPSPG